MRSLFRRLIFPMEWIYNLRLRGIHLDIGSGKGLFLRIISSTTEFTEGTEIRQKYLQDSYPSIVKVPTRTRYDVITIIDVLHHVPNKLELLAATIDKYEPGCVIIKDMSNEKYFPKFMNRLHDFFFGHGDLISEVDEAELALFMRIKGYELVESKKTQILWYNHFIHEYRVQ